MVKEPLKNQASRMQCKAKYRSKCRPIMQISWLRAQPVFQRFLNEKLFNAIDDAQSMMQARLENAPHYGVYIHTALGLNICPPAFIPSQIHCYNY